MRAVVSHIFDHVRCGIILTVTVQAACAQPAPITPAHFQESSAVAAPLALPETGWWHIFNDPTLNELMQRVGRNNKSIEQAAAHLALAQAKLRGAKADRFPQVGVNASGSHQTGPLINAAGGEGTLYTFGGNLSYEVDIFGKLSKAQQAAHMDAAQHEALLRSAKLLAEVEAAQNYFTIAALKSEEQILASALDHASRTASILQERFGRGLASELDVLQARTERGGIASDLSAIKQRRAEAEHALAFVLGEAQSVASVPSAVMTSPPTIPADIPSSLLIRRPDVAASERAMDAATLRYKIAKTSWFPRIGLTASGGAASPALSDLLKTSAQSAAVAAFFSLPIFDGGRRKADIQAAKAAVELAAADYHIHMLTAFREVEDQLSAVRLLGEQSQQVRANVESSERSLRILESRYERGLASMLDFLEAQRTELKYRRADVQITSARYLATINLIRSLGGGWPSGI